MTTILYDPKKKTLYSDSQCTVGNIVSSLNSPKIISLEIDGLGTCLFAYSGDIRQLPVLTAWLSGKRDRPPEFSKDATEDEDQYQAFALDRSGTLYNIEYPFPEFYPSPTQNNLYSLGSGGDIVLAAMAANPDPIKAMDVAKQLDIYSGGQTWMGRFVSGEPTIEKVS